MTLHGHKKTDIFSFHFSEVPSRVRFPEWGRKVVARGQAMRSGGFRREDEPAVEADGGDGYTPTGMSSVPLNCTLQSG